jgi:hypothetical protein
MQDLPLGYRRPTLTPCHPLRFLTAGSLAALLLLPACTSGGNAQAAPPSPKGPAPSPSAPAGHVWWGIGGDHMLSVVPRLQQEIGRPFAVVRTYTPWDGHIPGAVVVMAATHGAIPYVSWDLHRTSGPQPTFADVADGSQDPVIRKQARSVRNSGVRMFFTFAHQPEVAREQGATQRLGSASEYVRAYERVHRIFEQEKALNVVWVVTLSDLTYAGANGGARAWLPAPGDYSYLGVDGYVTWPCEQEGGRTFAQIFAPAERLSKKLGAPLFIGEVGDREPAACAAPTTAQEEANWITAAAATAETWPNLEAICWTYGNDRTRGHGSRVLHQDSSPQALAAFRAAGLDPWFGRMGWS